MAEKPRTAQDRREPRGRSSDVGLRAVQGRARWTHRDAGLSAFRRAGEISRRGQGSRLVQDLARRARTTRLRWVDSIAGDPRHRGDRTERASAALLATRTALRELNPRHRGAQPNASIPWAAPSIHLTHF